MVNLAEYRRQKGYSQQDIANEIGISKSGYCNIELRRYMPSVKTAKKIAKILNVDWRDLYE